MRLVILSALFSLAAGLIAGQILTLLMPAGHGHALGTVVAVLVFALLLRGWLRARPADSLSNAIVEAEEAVSSERAVESNILVPVVRALPVPALLVDRRRHILAVSPLARKLLNRAAEGRLLPELVRHPGLLSAVQQSVETGETLDVTITETVPVDRILQAKIAPLSGVSGQDDGSEGPLDDASTLILLRDLTDQARAESTRVDFVANVSHELRTPLASITGFLETLRGPAAEDPKARDSFLQIMEDQAARMTRLVDTLMSLNRIEQEQHVAPSGQVDLNACIDQVADALGIVARQVGTRIDVRHEARPAIVAGDRDQLAQVARNLIENALKYGARDSLVTVRIASQPPSRDETDKPPTGESIALVVSDRGEGIPEEHLSRLTERFYRVDSARSRADRPSSSTSGGESGRWSDGEGAGLGLAIVKHIVARHSGRLEISSVIGEGSTFTVFLPAADFVSDEDAGNHEQAVDRDAGPAADS